MSTEAMHASLRENLRLMMQRKGYSQRGLSRMAALDETAVKQILSGRSRSPRLETVARLAVALETSVARLVGDRPSDMDYYAGLVDGLEIMRGQGLLGLDEQEVRTVAAAIAEGLAGVADTDHGGNGENAGRGRGHAGTAHVDAVVRNLMSLRKFRGPEAARLRREARRDEAVLGDEDRPSADPEASGPGASDSGGSDSRAPETTG